MDIKGPLITLALILIITSKLHGFSTHNVQIERIFDTDEVPINSTILVTVTFSNLEEAQLRGFHYSEQIPIDIEIEIVSAKMISGVESSDLMDVIIQKDIQAGYFYPDYISYRWILERPPIFEENGNNAIPPIDCVEITYTITSSIVGSFDFIDFSWIGFFQEFPDPAFGISEMEVDAATIHFIDEQCNGESPELSTFASKFGITDRSNNLDECLSDINNDKSIDGRDLSILANQM